MNAIFIVIPIDYQLACVVSIVTETHNKCRVFRNAKWANLIVIALIILDNFTRWPLFGRQCLGCGGAMIF